MGKRLSSCCRCGPKDTAIHEMGKCPKLFVDRQAVKKQHFPLMYGDNRILVEEEKEAPNRIKPPWEK